MGDGWVDGIQAVLSIAYRNLQNLFIMVKNSRTAGEINLLKITGRCCRIMTTCPEIFKDHIEILRMDQLVSCVVFHIFIDL